MRFNAKTIGPHLLGWILFFGLIIGFISYSPEGRLAAKVFTPDFLLFVVVYLILFYANAYFLFPRFYLKKNYLAYFAIILLAFFVVLWLQPFDRLASFKEHSPPFMPGDPPFQHKPPRLGMHRPGRGPGRAHFDILSIVLFITVWSASTAMQIVKQWRTTEKRALQAEAEKVNAELSFLKAQINPHFLFNTLNNIYSLAIVKSENTPDAIMKLSRILRYVTDDVLNDFVPLQSEIDCIQNYIALQKLRLTSKVKIEFEVVGNLDGKKIAPLLFMTFIENAFKYGVSSHEPCLIKIRIEITDTEIKFVCENKILVKDTNEERVGVGINNAKKRLNYLYPGKHFLGINTEKGVFSVQLNISA